MHVSHGIQVNNNTIQEQQNQIETLRSTIKETVKNISDFGVSTITKDQVFVPFNDEFKKLLTTRPVVTVTPIGVTVNLTILSQTVNGFIVKVNKGENIDFNWIALAKIKTGSFQVPHNYCI